MTLLLVALAYLLGLAAARWWWGAAPAQPLPPLLWLLPLLLLPLAPYLDHLARPRVLPAMRWPAAAGFEPPGERVKPGLVAAVALCFAAGFLRYGGQPLHPAWGPANLAYYNLPAGEAFDRQAPQVTITGQVDSYPLLVDGVQEFLLAAATIQPRPAAGEEGAAQPVQGSARVTSRSAPPLRYGQQVAVSGRLSEGGVIDGFSYTDYLAVKGVGSVIYGAEVQPSVGVSGGNPLLAALYDLRARGAVLLARHLPEPAAALASGMLLGIKAGIPDALYEQFNRTGTSHVIVISGTNVALVSGAIVLVAARLLGRRRALWPALAAVACYALLVGGEAAVLRAALMGGLFVLAAALDRRGTALVSLAAACLLITLCEPLALWDVGLQLSSAATAGLVLLAPPVRNALHRLFGWVHACWRPPMPSAATEAARAPGTVVGAEAGVAATGAVRAPGTVVGAGAGIAATEAARAPGTVVDRAGAGVADTVADTAADVLAVTLAASLATLPLVLTYFGRLSLVSLPANLLIAPVQPLILLAGNAALLLGLAGLEQIAGLLLWLPWLGLGWTVAAVRWCAALPFAALDIPNFGPWHVMLAYAALIAARWPRPLLTLLLLGPQTSSSAPPVPGAQTSSSAPPARPQFPLWAARLIVSPASLLAAAALAALLWAAVLAQPDGRLHVWFLDVGQGDGILIQTPGGRQVLIDGGASATALLGELGAVMPFWDRTLDLLVLTHPDADHMAAQVEAVGRFAVASAWETPAAAAGEESAAWRAAVAGAGAQVQVQSAGGWSDLGDGVALWVLSPPAQGFGGEDAGNQNSLVLKLVYGDFSVLLTGDAGEAAEAALLAGSAPLGATVLKVAHHGSKSSSGAAFVGAVDPALAVIQVGAENRYGHPSAETLERLGGRAVLRTDEEGRIEVSSDGRQVWMETGK